MKKIAVASGKGGTGKTFLSTNLHALMEQSGRHTVLVDCDAEVPNASVFVKGEVLGVRETKMLCPVIDASKCTMCGKCAEYCAFNAICCIPAAKYIKITEDLCHGCGACLYECQYHAVEKAWKTIGKVKAYGVNGCIKLVEARIKEGEHSPVAIIRDAIQYGAESGAELLLLDAPPGCSCPFVNTVMDADYVLLVTEPTPFGLSDLKHTVDVLRKLDKPFGVVINRADLGDGTMKEYLASENIPLLAEIPYSERIAELYSGGKITALEDAEMREIFENLIQRIL